ncbi:protein CysZ [gamma proteobacterium HTCC5015]|nr:protein CysZ [gamma proteobacterium HTCC5015]
MTEFMRGFRYAVDGFKIIKAPKLRRYVIVPFIVNMVLFSLGLWYLGSEFGRLMDNVPTWLPQSIDMPSWLSWLEGIYQGFMAVLGWLQYLMWLLFFALYLIVVFYTFTIVTNIICAPFNGFFSAAVERHLLGDEVFHIERSIAEEVRLALVSEVRKLLYMLKYLIPLLGIVLLMWVTVLPQPLIPVVWFAYGAWMLSFDYADYPLGNHGLTFAEERPLLKQHRGLALGFGSAIMLMTMVPVLNFFAVPVGVAGATKLYLGRLRESVEQKPCIDFKGAAKE